MKTIGFHDKTKYVTRLKEHQRLDQIVQGTGFESNGKTKGCAIGCCFDYYDHTKGSKECGIPEVILRLADTLFEGLPVKEAKKFALDWVKSTPEGVNLMPVKWKFCAFILRENIERVLLLKIDDKLKEKVVDSIQGVLKLHEQATKTGKWDGNAASAWSAAWSAESAAARSAESAAESAAAWSAESAAAWSAESAAASAARSAENAARSAESAAAWSAESAAESAARSAESAARSAARSAESAAASAARSAESAAARSAAWSAESAAARSAESAAYIRYAKEFIRLLKAEGI